MTTYRRIWRMGSTLLALLGTTAAIVLWSVPTTLVIFGCATVLTASTTTGLALAEDAPMSRRELVAVVTTRTLLASLATVALLGFGAVFGVAVILVVLLVAASCPPAAAFYLRCFGSSSRRGPGPEPADGAGEARRPAPADSRPAVSRSVFGPVETGPGDLDEVELCRAWCRSYWALQEASSPAERVRIVEDRQGYLDELDRRHPGSLADWFRSGARPGGDPSKFLARDIDRSHRPE